MQYLAQVITNTPTPIEGTVTPATLPQTGSFIPLLVMCVFAGFLIYFGFREKLI
jgi:hypothetical protein